MQPSSLFPDQPDLSPEIPPTWAEDSDVYHTSARCKRLQAIHRNKRITGRPGSRLRLCFHCEDILRAKRAG